MSIGLFSSGLYEPNVNTDFLLLILLLPTVDEFWFCIGFDICVLKDLKRNQKEKSEKPMQPSYQKQIRNLFIIYSSTFCCHGNCLFIVFVIVTVMVN